VALFLQRLPKEIRVLLTHEDHSDLRRLAAHADRLVAYSGKQGGTICASATEEPLSDVVAAVGGKRQHQKKGKQQPPPVPPRPQSSQNSQQKPPKETTPSSLARQSSGLCFYHWAYGDKAHSCKEPCSWQGN